MTQTIDFSATLNDYLKGDQLYSLLEDDEGLPYKLYNDLRAMGLRSIWHRIMWHSISQNGLEWFAYAMEDGAILSELFDFNNTEEGWDFWQSMNKLLS